MSSYKDLARKANDRADPHTDALLDRVKASPYTVAIVLAVALGLVILGAWLF